MPLFKPLSGSRMRCIIIIIIISAMGLIKLYAYLSNPAVPLCCDSVDRYKIAALWFESAVILLRSGSDLAATLQRPLCSDLATILRRVLAVILQRSCRDLAEILQRSCSDIAKEIFLRYCSDLTANSQRTRSNLAAILQQRSCCDRAATLQPRARRPPTRWFW